jgi:geranylgeranyl diphosphate synthase type I
MLEAIERDLQIAVNPHLSPFPDSLQSMISHHMGWSEGNQPSGKRIRPLLSLLICDAAQAEWEMALPAASAIEIIHNFSLVHDDIEDNSDTRRGRPTIWKIWGIPQAINTGDALFALARTSTKRLIDQGYAAETVLKVESELDKALLSLTLGQHLDLQFESENDVSVKAYLHMIKGKTAALIQASTTIGGILARCDPEIVHQLAQFGNNLGLAFQITDDILGIWGDPAVTGKPTGDDLLMGKKSLPVVHGLVNSTKFKSIWSKADSREDNLKALMDILESTGSKKFALKQADEHTQRALSSLSSAFPQQPANQDLSELANRLLVRDY